MKFTLITKKDKPWVVQLLLASTHFVLLPEIQHTSDSQDSLLVHRHARSLLPLGLCTAIPLTWTVRPQTLLSCWFR